MGIVNIRGTDFEVPIGFFTGTLYYQAETKDADQAVAEFERKCARLFGIYPKAHGSWTFVFHPERKSLAVSGPFLVIPFRDREDFERRCEGSAFNISEMKGPIPMQEDPVEVPAEWKEHPLPALVRLQDPVCLPVLVRLQDPVCFYTDDTDLDKAIEGFERRCWDLTIQAGPFRALSYELDAKSKRLLVHGDLFAIFSHGPGEFTAACKKNDIEASFIPCRDESFPRMELFTGTIKYRTISGGPEHACSLFEKACGMLGIYPESDNLKFNFAPSDRTLSVYGKFYVAPYDEEKDFRGRCLACGMDTNGLFIGNLDPFSGRWLAP